MHTAPPLLMAGFFWRALKAQGRLHAALGGAALLALLVALVPVFTPMPWQVSAAVITFTIAVVLWWIQVDGLLQQNRPMLARLVPGHVARLRRSLLLQWLVFTAAFTVLATLQTLSWGWPWWALATLWALVIGGLSWSLVWLNRQPMLWLVVALLTLTLPLMLPPKAERAGWPDALQAWTGNPTLSGPWLVLGGLLLGGLLGLAMGAGHARHRGWVLARERMRQASRLDQAAIGLPVRMQTGWRGALYRLYGWPWLLLLRHTLQQPVRHPLAGRLNLVLAGPMHWTRQVGVLMMLCLLVALLVGLIGWLAPPMQGKPWLGLRYGLCIAIFGLALNPVVQHGVALRARQRSYALLRLLPGVPQGAALERAWQVHLTRLFAIGWSLAALAVVGGLVLVDATTALPFVAGFAAACLPLLPLSLMAHAGSIGRSPSGWRQGAASAATMIAGMVGGGMAEMLEVPAGLSLGLGAAVAVGLAVVGRLRGKL